jgi:hypothetical protein
MLQILGWRTIVILLLFMATGCNRDSADDGQTYSPPYAPLVMIDAERSERLELEKRVAQLEEKDEIYHFTEEFKLSDGGMGFVETSFGSAPFQWLQSNAHGNGTKVTVKIGNPTRADWNRMRVYGLAVAQ